MASKTHKALVTVAPRAPFEIHEYPTIQPTGDEIRIHVQWRASTPLELHEADGGLLLEPPQRTGRTSAGIVVEVGPDAKRLKVGGKVLGYAHQKPSWQAHQGVRHSP
ncbi:chaperonin 10-like protein [Hypoxylon fragiforme]|uniref:chaperonin 10-like protein n=1 Tax=Hypoxylon fragiforme TaxID=63214 RepID=UPI0020C6D71A|nr:chaperonin 10-like protein [Hypoxylon fragiforme]KAI2612191.1 chaperonin 10-like protein [Hypoxylon fragiforme]